MTKFCKQTELALTIFKDIDVLLIDIEGTTTPITFVTEVLFPFAKENIKKYLEEKWDEKETQKDVEDLRKQVKLDIANNVEDVPPICEEGKQNIIADAVKNVHWQISKDRKITALKQLQGHIWRSGYDSGELKSIIYDDVKPALEDFKEMGKKIYIYSSGSVEAQKLLFKHTKNGDLTSLLSGYFDTKTGGKRESASYTKISEKINCKPQKILFLTDVVEEAVAASDANVKTCILLRPGNKKISDENLEKFLTINSFDQLLEEEPATKMPKLQS